MATVGMIANPHAGKDVRRLVSAAAHTSDASLVGTLRRAMVGVVEGGADRIVTSRDSRRLAERAGEGLSVPVHVLDLPLTGTRADTIGAASAMRDLACTCVISLGGDGTNRDIATGWPNVPLIAMSTGTNNVFPRSLEPTSAGLAAGLLASGKLRMGPVTAPSKRVRLRRSAASGQLAGQWEEIALVEAALVDGSFIGSRAVERPDAIRWVVAAIAEPACTGLASIAGRVMPIGRADAGGVLVRLGPDGTGIRVPLMPGRFDTVNVVEATWLSVGETVELPAGGVLAFDGERTVPLSSATTVVVSIDAEGPLVVDVDAALRQGLGDQRFRAMPLAQADEAQRTDKEVCVGH